MQHLIIMLWAHHASTLFKNPRKREIHVARALPRPFPTCVASVSAVAAATGHCQW